MTLNEAFDYMDLLLDKADQPYFTTDEKNKFLSLAISDFININYQKMATDEDARRALSGCVDYNAFSLTAAEIISGSYIFSSYLAPALSKKYEDDDGKALVVTPAAGTTAAVTVSASDVVFYKPIQVKNKSIRQYREDRTSGDPFNGIGDGDFYHPDSGMGAQWTYSENSIMIEPRKNIARVDMETITLPTVEQAFSSDTRESSSSVPPQLVFSEHYQRQIVELAVSKMTKVDIGLMTPSTE
jgi:hypothetical protein